MKFKKSIFSICLGAFCMGAILSLTLPKEKNAEQPVDYVTIAILAKDKAHTLPLYLTCLEQQTWPASKSYLYIRTNNNNDNTVEILQEWLEKVKDRYAGVYFDDTDVPEPVQNYKQHEWNSERFVVLGKIRQDSVDYAQKNKSHYFVADCDNFITPTTIEKMMSTNLPIVAPLLKVTYPSCYSNYHAAIDQNGYFANSPHYLDILSQNIKGLVELPVVHCCYFIRHDVLDKMLYNDQSFRYEYVVFSDTARKQKIPQYLDNREVYGRITFAETAEEFEKEPWIYEFQNPKEKLTSIFTNIYKNGVWGINKAGIGSSGYGSTLENTVSYRAYLENFISNENIESVVDIGCGDWEFSQHVDWNECNYIGYDVVKSVIENNNKSHSNQSIKFINENFLDADLPAADLLICKDVLQYLSNEEILAFLPQLKKFKHCLITNDYNPMANINTEVGGYRPLDLTKPPFNMNGQNSLLFSVGPTKKQIFYLNNPKCSLEEKIYTSHP